MAVTEQRDNQGERRARQARKVIIWTGLTEVAAEAQAEGSLTWAVFLRNLSDEPVFEAKYALWRRVGESVALQSSSGLPTLLPPTPDLVYPVEVVQPGDDVRYAVIMQFRDASNVWWIRHADGTLSSPMGAFQSEMMTLTAGTPGAWD